MLCWEVGMNTNYACPVHNFVCQLYKGVLFFSRLCLAEVEIVVDPGSRFPERILVKIPVISQSRSIIGFCCLLYWKQKFCFTFDINLPFHMGLIIETF